MVLPPPARGGARMIAVLLYGLALLAAALLSARAHESALSASVLFLGLGLVASALGWVQVAQDSPVVQEFAQVAMVAVLFSDGMRTRARELRREWRLPARALGVGMPLAFAVLAWLAHAAAGLAWGPALLLAGVATPTDPVFASALVDRQEVAAPLRRTLNIESGFNDGVALPMVLGVLGWMGVVHHSPWALAAEVLGGAAIGIAVPWAAHALQRLPFAKLRGPYEALFVAAIGVVTFACAVLTGCNAYIASFCAGITVNTLVPPLADGFRPVGERVSLLLKFATLLAFGAMVSPAKLVAIGAGSWLFVAGALLVARPAGVLLSLVGSPMHWHERLAAAWFGPKGFGSVVYAFIVLRSGVAEGPALFHLAAALVTVSIVAHSSTDVPTAHWLSRRQREAQRSARE